MNQCDLDKGICITDEKWIPIDQIEQLETGDLVETPSKFPKHYPIVGNMVVPIVYHYGIYLEVDGKGYIVHNPFGGKPEMVTLEQFETDRKIEKVIRTGLPADYILKKFKECEGKPYLFFSRNCEDFIRYVTGARIGYDQRIGWALFAILLVIIIILITTRRK